jgi:hypothetical protein
MASRHESEVQSLDSLTNQELQQLGHFRKVYVNNTLPGAPGGSGGHSGDSQNPTSAADIRRIVRDTMHGNKTYHFKKEPFEYTGTNESLKRWITAVETHFQAKNIPPSAHYAVAKAYLKDKALYVVELAEHDGTLVPNAHHAHHLWRDLRNFLESQFASSLANFSLQMTFSRRTQLPNESVDQYVNSMLELAARLELSQDTVMGRIMAGFRDDIFSALTLKQPDSLTQLVQYAKLAEGIVKKKGSNALMKALRLGDDMEEVSNDDLSDLLETAQRPYIQKLNAVSKELGTLTKSFADHKSKLDQQKAAPPASDGSQHPQKYNTYRGGSRNGCWVCGSKFHIRRYCPDAHRTQPSGGGGSNGGYRGQGDQGAQSSQDPRNQGQWNNTNHGPNNQGHQGQSSGYQGQPSSSQGAAPPGNG